MKNKFTLNIAAMLLISTNFYAQDGRIGINTPDPKTTLDVNGKTDASGNVLTMDKTGLQAPRLTRAELTAKGNTLYGADQKGALVYITDVSGGDTLDQRTNITTIGYYYFDGSIWNGLKNNTASYTPGDIKHSVKTADHDGWYLLDGRTVSSLPANAQLAANNLGFTVNIPDATNRVLKTKTSLETLGTTGGSNTLNIAQTNLPNINLSGAISGTAQANGDHSHAFSATTSLAGIHAHGPIAGTGFLLGGTTIGNNGTGNYQGNGLQSSWGGVGLGGATANAGNHTHTLSGTTANTGSHTHTVSGTTTVSTGGANTAMNNMQAYLVVNTFIYLGL